MSNDIDRSEEQALLRQTVADITIQFGDGYYTAQARAGAGLPSCGRP